MLSPQAGGVKRRLGGKGRPFWRGALWRALIWAASTLFVEGDESFFGRMGAVLGVLVAAAGAFPAFSQSQAVRIAVHTSLDGEDDAAGRSYIDAVRFAIEEANESGIGPHIEIDTYDDKGTEQGARTAAEKIAASQALVVVGPLFSTSSVAAGPGFEKAGIASIVAASESDRVTDAETTFQSTFKNSDLGVAYGGYLSYALNGRRAAVIFPTIPTGARLPAASGAARNGWASPRPSMALPRRKRAMKRCARLWAIPKSQSLCSACSRMMPGQRSWQYAGRASRRRSWAAPISRTLPSPHRSVASRRSSASRISSRMPCSEPRR